LEFAAERGVHFFEQPAAEPEAGMALGEGFVYADQKIEDFAFSWREFVESGLQTFLEIFQDQRDQADVGDFVLYEGFADEFRTEGAEMDYRGSASERTEKSDHEIDGVIGRKNTEVADAGPERI
jgi:hypothetical protein